MENLLSCEENFATWGENLVGGWRMDSFYRMAESPSPSLLLRKARDLAIFAVVGSFVSEAGKPSEEEEMLHLSKRFESELRAVVGLPARELIDRRTNTERSEPPPEETKTTPGK